ncbi:hypothetical protein EUGRSUZ_C02140 [Eucalyptus grandis]|uniref:Uncharacterized protein n=2 Tax=Eucalyptus grandis TaxID=71139 RepID=A0A059CQU5_EUCGR|nr:hypothetical protein EUGRSUZ_C02140 [Eucalyptus grandis]
MSCFIVHAKVAKEGRRPSLIGRLHMSDVQGELIFVCSSFPFFLYYLSFFFYSTLILLYMLAHILSD